MEAVGSRKIGQDAMVLRGSQTVVDGVENATYPRGRVCRASGCVTVLSVYNPADHCWQHEPVRPFVLRAPHPGRRGSKRDREREPRELTFLAG